MEYTNISGGPSEIKKAFNQLKKEDVAIAVTDVLNDEHRFLGEAVKDFKLITGGSNRIALRLPSQLKSNKNHEKQQSTNYQRFWVKNLFYLVVVLMTLAQVNEFSKSTALKPNPVELAESNSIRQCCRLGYQARKRAILVYASAPPDTVKVQQRLDETSLVVLSKML